MNIIRLINEQNTSQLKKISLTFFPGYFPWFFFRYFCFLISSFKIAATRSQNFHFHVQLLSNLTGSLFLVSSYLSSILHIVKCNSRKFLDDSDRSIFISNFCNGKFVFFMLMKWFTFTFLFQSATGVYFLQNSTVQSLWRICLTIVFFTLEKAIFILTFATYFLLWLEPLINFFAFLILQNLFWIRCLKNIILKC